MPEIGDRKTAQELGFRGSDRRVWTACPNCGKPRWVISKRGYLDKICRQCRDAQHGLEMRLTRQGTGNPNWKGGRQKNIQGYVLVKLQPDDFFYPMAKWGGYVREHRLIMARHLGRCLHRWELVHHKGKRYSDIRNKSDNLKDNLELTASIGEHSRNHTKGYKDGFRKGYEDGKSEALRP